ncbi:hypothetical protein [Actinomadura hibisca]|uniref:hypothetical protein n=1 Tax=Actinomadura hibisca TaxID=68565 RepID=UPI000832E654|nr:hypothetical protein [Actinomadura hibisca]
MPNRKKLILAGLGTALLTVAVHVLPAQASSATTTGQTVASGQPSGGGGGIISGNHNETLLTS